MDEESKWFFCLDELDVLEFAYQAVADNRHADKEHRKMEERVLQEQETVEEDSEEELEKRLGDTPLVEECSVHHHHDPTDASVDELLASSAVGSNVLAVRAYRFFRTMSLWLARTDGTVCYEDVFRIKANAPLIPAKIAFAGIELEHTDPASLLIAEKELDVARIYLSRLLASCETLRREEVMNAEEALAFLSEGEALLIAVIVERDRLRSLMKFRRL